MSKTCNEYLNTWDEQQLSRAVEAYGDSLTYYLLGYVKNYQTAEDVMMMSFAHIVAKKLSFSNDKAFKCYLYRVATSRALDCLRKTRRQKTLPLESAEEIADKQTLLEEVLASERKSMIADALAQLPVDYRVVLSLSYFDGFQVAEIARVLHKNIKQVYNLLARAKASMRELLKGVDIYE